MVSEIPVFLILGALVGGFVNGLAGFGTALMALGFWLQIMPPLEAVALVVVVSCVTGIQGLWIVRKTVQAQWRRLARFLIPALFGIPLGLFCLHLINPIWLKFLVAGLMIAYGVFFLVRRNLPTFSRSTPITDNAIGLVSGVLGGLAGLSGALPAMWLALRPWPKEETRAVLQPFSFATLLISAVLLAIKGAYTPKILFWLVVASLAALTSAQLGVFIYRRSTSSQFRWLLIIMLFLSGMALMTTELVDLFYA
jgi:uncharacterized membrane protein YfcA